MRTVLLLHRSRHASNVKLGSHTGMHTFSWRQEMFSPLFIGAAIGEQQQMRDGVETPHALQTSTGPSCVHGNKTDNHSTLAWQNEQVSSCKHFTAIPIPHPLPHYRVSIIATNPTTMHTYDQQDELKRPELCDKNQQLASTRESRTITERPRTGQEKAWKCMACKNELQYR